MRRTRAVFAVTLLASFLVQAAWVIAVPPFLSRDEYQHAFRAADVASGDWSTHHVRLGRGALVAAPRGLVKAASPVCSAFPESDYFNCHPLKERTDGLVDVISTAAAYNPLYYWIPGTVAKAFDGTNALYAMRIASAMLCALLIALSAAVTSERARTYAPYVGLALGLTPAFLYASAMVGPNGLEMSAGLLLWSALLSILRSGGSTSRLAVTSAALGGAVLGVVRGLGPLWLVMILATWAILVPRQTWTGLRSQRRNWLCATAIALGTAGGVTWSVVAKIADGLPREYPGSPWAAGVRGLSDWLVDAFAAFPLGRQYAPPAVYAIGFLLWCAFALPAAPRAGRRMYTALAVLVLFAVSFPFFGTVATYHHVGSAWQGRYELPFTCGFALLLAHVLDEHAIGMASRRALVAVFTGAFAMNLISTWHIVRVFRSRAPTYFPAWHPPPQWVLAVVLAAGFMLPLLLAANRRGRPDLATGCVGSGRVSGAGFAGQRPSMP